LLSISHSDCKLAKSDANILDKETMSRLCENLACEDYNNLTSEFNRYYKEESQGKNGYGKSGVFDPAYIANGGTGAYGGNIGVSGPVSGHGGVIVGHNGEILYGNEGDYTGAQLLIGHNDLESIADT
jgi:hypothetical protein